MSGQILNVRPLGALPEGPLDSETSALPSAELARARAHKEILICMNRAPAPAYLAKLRQEVQANARFTENGNRGFKYTVALLDTPDGVVERDHTRSPFPTTGPVIKGPVKYKLSAFPLVDQVHHQRRVIVKQKRFKRFSEE